KPIGKMRAKFTEEQKQFVLKAVHVIDAFAKLQYKDKLELSVKEIEEIYREVKNINAENDDVKAIKKLTLDEILKFREKISKTHVQKIVKIKIEKEMIKKEAQQLKVDLLKIENNFFWKLLDMVEEKSREIRLKYEKAEINFKRLNNQYYELKNSEPMATDKDIIMCKMNIQKLLIDI
ncbi:hypothetical protein IJI31_03620, partial [bacterium]|nr:hypothetical protein [bacterium]